MEKTDVSILHLVDMVKSGELRLPEMQRGYVWTAARVRDLFDSLYRRYPSGSLLVWKTDDAPERAFAIEDRAKPLSGAKLLLDGQQRVTSLHAVFTGEPLVVKGRTSSIELLFNLDHPDHLAEATEVDEEATQTEEEKAEQERVGEDDELMAKLRRLTFVVATNRLRAMKEWVPVTAVLQSTGNREFLKAWGGALDDRTFDRYEERLNRLRAIRDYPYVMQILGSSMSYPEVTEVFVRVNSKGAKLRGSDLALAQITSRWKGGLSAIQSFLRRHPSVEPHGEGLVARAIVIAATGSGNFRNLSALSEGEIKEAWPKVERHLPFAGDYLRNNLRMDHPWLVSSPFLLLVTAYLHQTGWPEDEATRRQLERWLLLANGRGRYSGSSETRLDDDLRTVREGGGPEGLLRTLRSQTGRLDVTPEDLAEKSPLNPLFRLTFLALRARGMKDWSSGAVVDPGATSASGDIERHHIHPKATLARVDERLVNEIANQAFIGKATNREISGKPPALYLPRYVELSPELLTQHAIPEDRELWQTERYADFLEARRILLAEAIGELVPPGR